MNLAALPWLDSALLIPLLGAARVTTLASPALAGRWSLAALVLTLLAALGASLASLSAAPGSRSRHPDFEVDALASPMLPALCLLHGLTLLGTSKSRLSTGLCIRILLSLALTLAAVTCQDGTFLILLMLLAASLPVWDLRSRGETTRGFLIYLLPFALLLVASWFLWDGDSRLWAIGALLIAVKLCGGVFPLHGWIQTLFQRAGFGAALLFVLPVIEVVAAVRLLLPHAPAWMLHATSVACLVTALYAAAMSVVQRDVRRFFAFLALSQTSLVMFAVMRHSSSTLTAALCLWISLMVCLAGLGLALRALEARFGRLSLDEHHGYYSQVPGLALVFLLSGLASVGFPGTMGFIPMELLISSSAQQGLGFTLALALASMLNGIAILRVYFSLFTGRKSAPSVPLAATRPERWGIALVSSLVILGGWFSPGVVASRQHTADSLLATRPATTSSPASSLPLNPAP